MTYGYEKRAKNIAKERDHIMVRDFTLPQPPLQTIIFKIEQSIPQVQQIPLCTDFILLASGIFI
jgi:hypothetical protein